MAHMPVFFHRDQLNHKPLFEWVFGDKIRHPETTSRAESILAAVEANAQDFELRSPTRFPTGLMREVHDTKLLALYRTAMSLPADETYYPSVFPKRERIKPDPRNIRHAGYFCFDSGTPLNATTWAATAWSAACAVETAKVLEKGKIKASYALCRPPGHHASRDLFGGYCYVNNVALVARRLSQRGKVAILDIDFHHGDGTQKLFYDDSHVLTVSIHGDPREFFPFYTGYANERGAGMGKGFNLNLPQASGCDGEAYMAVLEEQALAEIRRFRPDALVVAAGFDTYVADPVGAFSLLPADFYEIGQRVAKLDLPTSIVQEGGYEAESLGDNVVAFLHGFMGR